MPRKARQTEIREATTRRATQRKTPTPGWTSRLYIDPSRIPRGFRYGWKRLSTHNEPDADHMSQLFSNGWRPVPAERHPEKSGDPEMMRRLFGATPGDGFIKEGGLLLCERDERSVRQDEEALRAHNLRQIQGIRWATDLPEDERLPGSRAETSIESVTTSGDFQRD